MKNILSIKIYGEPSLLLSMVEGLIVLYLAPSVQTSGHKLIFCSNFSPLGFDINE